MKARADSGVTGNWGEGWTKYGEVPSPFLSHPFLPFLRAHSFPPFFFAPFLPISPFLSPPFSIFLFVPLPYPTRDPLNPARRSEERCEFPQRGLGQSPSRNRIWCILRCIYILALKYDIWPRPKLACLNKIYKTRGPTTGTLWSFSTLPSAYTLLLRHWKQTSSQPQDFWKRAKEL